MISSHEAQSIAEEALVSPRRSGARVMLREFDDGWIAWAGLPDGTIHVDAGAEPRRLVIDRSSGRVGRWPPVSVEEILHDLAAAAAGGPPRFPPDAHAELRRAGWTPGRTVPHPDLDTYAQRLADLSRDEENGPLTIVDTAKPLLREFGGLVLRTATHTRHRLYPGRRDPDLDNFVYLEDMIGQRLTPIGWTDDLDDPSELVVATDGRAFVGDWSGVYLLAEDVDWALVRLTRGAFDAPLPAVGEDGSIDYVDDIGDPIDPATTHRPPADGSR